MIDFLECALDYGIISVCIRFGVLLIPSVEKHFPINVQSGNYYFPINAEISCRKSIYKIKREIYHLHLLKQIANEDWLKTLFIGVLMKKKEKKKDNQ